MCPPPTYHFVLLAPPRSRFPLRSYFGEDSRSLQSDEFFAMWLDWLQMYAKAVQKATVDAEKKAKAEAREREKAAKEAAAASAAGKVRVPVFAHTRACVCGTLSLACARRVPLVAQLRPVRQASSQAHDHPWALPPPLVNPPLVNPPLAPLPTAWLQMVGLAAAPAPVPAISLDRSWLASAPAHPRSQPPRPPLRALPAVAVSWDPPVEAGHPSQQPRRLRGRSFSPLMPPAHRPAAAATMMMAPDRHPCHHQTTHHGTCPATVAMFRSDSPQQPASSPPLPRSQLAPRLPPPLTPAAALPTPSVH